MMWCRSPSLFLLVCGGMVFQGLCVNLEADNAALMQTPMKQHSNQLHPSTSTVDQKKSVRHPVIIMGALMGSTLEVNDARPDNLCGNAWFPKWTTGYPFNARNVGCVAGPIEPQFALAFDTTTNRTKSPDNVQVRAAAEWAGFAGVAMLGSVHYVDLVEKLMAKGYVKDTNIFPMPYDWRLSVADWIEGTFPRMKTLIETAFDKTNETVVLTGVSMAGPFTHAFLMWAKATLGASWAARHVHAFVPASGPWNGAVNSLSALVGGALVSFASPKERLVGTKFTCPTCHPALTPDVPPLPHRLFGELLENLEKLIEVFAEDDLTKLLRQFPSFYWMSGGVDYSTQPPTDKSYVTLTNGHGTEKLKQNFTASMMPTVFRKIHEDADAERFEYALSVGATEDPGVPTHCIHSHNVRTFSHLTFPEDGNLTDGSVVELGDGDGTVHLDSLTVCERWQSTVKTYKVPGVPHAEVLTVHQAVEVVVAVAMENNTLLEAWTAPTFDELALLAHEKAESKSQWKTALLVDRTTDKI